MARINKTTVSEIKETVDQIVQSIVDSADDETRKWIESWVWGAMIPRFNRQ